VHNKTKPVNPSQPAAVLRHHRPSAKLGILLPFFVSQGERMKKVDTGIAHKDMIAMAKRLNSLLATQYQLYTKTLKFHWNVEGPFFGPLHGLFKENYEQLFGMVDTIAERVRALGVVSIGTLSEFGKMGSLKEEVGKNPKDQRMIALLLEGHETAIKQMRKDAAFSSKISDNGTTNMLEDMIEQQEKTAWMLRAHLTK